MVKLEFMKIMERVMKREIRCLMSAVLALLLVGCGSSSAASAETADSSAAQVEETASTESTSREERGFDLLDDEALEVMSEVYGEGWVIEEDDSDAQEIFLYEDDLTVDGVDYVLWIDSYEAGSEMIRMNAISESGDEGYQVYLSWHDYSSDYSDLTHAVRMRVTAVSFRDGDVLVSADSEDVCYRAQSYVDAEKAKQEARDAENAARESAKAEKEAAQQAFYDSLGYYQLESLVYTDGTEPAEYALEYDAWYAFVYNPDDPDMITAVWGSTDRVDFMVIYNEDGQMTLAVDYLDENDHIKTAYCPLTITETGASIDMSSRGKQLQMLTFEKVDRDTFYDGILADLEGEFEIW